MLVPAQIFVFVRSSLRSLLVSSLTIFRECIFTSATLKGGTTRRADFEAESFFGSEIIIPVQKFPAVLQTSNMKFVFSVSGELSLFFPFFYGEGTGIN